LRRGELVALRADSIPIREEHWVIADLLGKAGHIHTVQIPVGSKRQSRNGRMPEHVSPGATHTTERYLGCKQKLRCAVNDQTGIEPDDAR
jgi:hypothetical protein